jgi:enamine deaminase RidA (YjgF/YER057c/UK114 family)
MIERWGSGGPYEARIGYSRVVAADGHVWVSGCTSVVDGEVQAVGDAAEQTRVAIANAVAALSTAGCAVTDVVRTRMFVVDIATNGTLVGDAHGETFGDIRPAASMLGVTALLDPLMLVEIEVEAYRSSP